MSTLTNNTPKNVTLAEADDVGEQVVQTSKCKGATTIPIFLKSKFCYCDLISSSCRDTRANNETSARTWIFPPFLRFCGSNRDP